MLILSAVIVCLRFSKIDLSVVVVHRLMSLLTVSCVSQYVKDLWSQGAALKRGVQEPCGEYRGRTDDLLHAMQAL